MSIERAREILVGFSQAAARRNAAADLARHLGAEALLVFVRDAELDTLLPASGFPQTIRGGPEFRAFLRSCTTPGTHHGRVDYPTHEARTPALAHVIDDGTVLLLLGGKPDGAAVEELARTMPLISAMLRAEHSAQLAIGEAQVARAAGRRAHDLAMALDGARGDLERALNESARLNEQLQETDRRKDEFLAMLGHELRNPMAAISSALEVMRLSDDGGAPRRIVEQQSQQLSRLIDDLLDVARITRDKIALRLEPVDVNAVAMRAVEATRALVVTKNHALVVRTSGPLWAMVDPTRGEQMITTC